MRLTLCALSALILSNPALAQTCSTEQAERLIIESPAPQAGAQFGAMVQQFGDTLAIGATSSNNIYIFNRDETNWNYYQTLSVPQADGPMAIGHEVLAVASSAVEGNRGRVRIYEPFPTGQWREVNNLQPSDLSSDARFGHSVAIGGSLLVVGARMDAGWRGSAYVYERRASDGAWVQLSKLDPGVSGWQEFGINVAISGDTIFVAAVRCAGCLGNGNGKVYVFNRTGPATWALSQIITDPTGDNRWEFGHQGLAAGGSVLAVASHTTPLGTATRVGAVYVFERDGEGTWQFANSVHSPIGAVEQAFFGYMLACDGESIVAGYDPNNEVRVSVIRKVDGTWVCTRTLNPSNDGLASQGVSAPRLQINQNGVWFGTPTSNGQVGAVYQFAYPCDPPAVAAPSPEVVASAGGTAALTVSASPGATAQWYRDAVALEDSDRVSGASTPSLQISQLTAEDIGTYRCQVTNGCGTTSANVHLQLDGTVPVTWPASMGGNDHRYEVRVVEGPITWVVASQAALSAGGTLATITSPEENQFVFDLTRVTPGAWRDTTEWNFGPWLGGRRSSPGSNQWGWVTGEPWNFAAWFAGQPDSLTQDFLLFGRGGRPPLPVWSDANDGEDVRAFVVEYVTPCPLPQITQDPEAQALLPGSTVQFVVETSASDATFAWKYQDQDLQPAPRLSGIDGPVVTITNVQPSDQGLYSCTVTTDCGSATSQSAALSCRPIILAQPADETWILVGTTLSIDVPAGASYTYRWRQNGQNLFNIPGVITGVTTRSLVLQLSDPSLIGEYDCVLTNACGVTTSNPIAVLCPADFDHDGGITTGDIGAFFAAYERGESAADVDIDGGITPGDVARFFGVFEAGGC